MEEKTLAQELRESLCYKPTDATVAMTADEIATADAYCEEYKAFLVLQLQRRFHGVLVVGVRNDGHGGPVQGAVVVDGDFSGGVRDLLYANKNLHFGCLLTCS